MRSPSLKKLEIVFCAPTREKHSLLENKTKNKDATANCVPLEDCAWQAQIPAQLRKAYGEKRKTCLWYTHTSHPICTTFVGTWEDIWANIKWGVWFVIDAAFIYVEQKNCWFAQHRHAIYNSYMHKGGAPNNYICKLSFFVHITRSLVFVWACFSVPPIPLYTLGASKWAKGETKKKKKKRNEREKGD